MIIDDLVVATDSTGGIGPKPADTVYADAATVAHFALRVPLLEVICAGATPILVIDDLCVELEPTGRQMIAEIHRLAAAVGLPPEAVTGSTEENVPTAATGIGVTVLGRLAESATTKPGGAVDGDLVLCAGLPLSAPRDGIHIGHPDQVTVAAVAAVVASGLVHDALPVGSKGLSWEVPQLAASANLGVHWLPSPVARTDSGGPSSCVLFSVDAAVADHVRMLCAPAPVHTVARLQRGAAGHHLGDGVVDCRPMPSIG
ncbi:AIR synthase related protein [Tessaracoccus sp. G1721]